MSDLTKSIDIVFGAKNNLSPEIARLEKDFSDFDRVVTAAATPLANLGDKILVTETAILALAAAFTGKAIEAAGQFGDSIEEIGTLFGGTKDQVGQFGTQVLDYASTSTQSIDAINGAIYKAVSAGVDYQTVLGTLTAAEQLSVAGRADLESVTVALTGTMNAYGASTEEAAKYSDIMFTAVKSGNTTVSELASGLGQVTGIAASAGIPFETLAAAVSSLTSYGIGTSEAITGIKAAISNIIAPSGEAAKAAEALGIQFDAGALKSKGLEGVLKDVMAATHGNIGEMTNFFGSVEGLNVALTLGADKSGKFGTALAAMADSTGATKAAFDAMANNFGLAMQSIANAADTALIKAGQPLLQQFGGVAEGIAAIFRGLGQGIDSGAFDPVIQAIGTFGQSAATALAEIAKNLPAALGKLDFSGLINSFGGLGDAVKKAFEQIFGDIDLTTPEGLASALQTIVNGITALTNVTAGIVDSFGPIFTAFGDLAREAGAAGGETQTATGKFIGVAQQIVAFGTGLTAALTLFNETGKSVVDVVTLLVGGVQTVFNAAQIGIDVIAAAVLIAGQKIAEAMALITFGDTSKDWQAKADEYGDLLDQLNERVNGNVTDMAAGWQKVTAGMDGLSGAAGGVATATGQIATATDTATGAAQEFVGIDWSQGQDGMQYIRQAAKNLGIALTNAANPAQAFAGYIKTAGDESDIARALTNGYRLEIDELGNRTFIPVIENTKRTTEATRKSEQAMLDAAKAAVDYDLKLREIESKERIAYIEAKFKVDEAQIKADAERVVAAFESINTAITSTGETLGSLVGTWAQLAGSFEGAKLWDLIQKEEERRQQAFEQQKQLVAEQIAYMKARVKTLEKGDTLIKVNADGLAPELERIFHEILRRCQIKANEQGLELLLAGA